MVLTRQQSSSVEPHQFKDASGLKVRASYPYNNERLQSSKQTDRGLVGRELINARVPRLSALLLPLGVIAISISMIAETAADQLQLREQPQSIVELQNADPVFAPGLQHDPTVPPVQHYLNYGTPHPSHNVAPYDGQILVENNAGGFTPLEPTPMRADCGYSCPASWSAKFEALSLYRAGHSGPEFSTGFKLGEFGYDGTARISLNRRVDCLDGWEFVAVGPLESEESEALAIPGITSVFTSPVFNLSAFNTDVVFQSLTYTSRVHSFELNRRYWGWDVISTYAGLRYINIDDDILFESENMAGETGLLQIKTDNYLAGPQIGFDLFYPLDRWTAEGTIKGSLFAAGTESTFFLANAGTLELFNSDDKVRLSAMFELALRATYEVTPNISLRAGYEFWYIYGLAVAPGQIDTILTPTTGDVTRNRSDIVYHGASVGIEGTW